MIKTNHISKVLGELKEHKLVECIAPEVQKSIFIVIETGKDIARIRINIG